MARAAPIYHEPTSLSRPHRIGLPKMSIQSVAAQLTTLAAEGEHGGNHNSLDPLVTGGGAFLVLLLLLWITTRFNRDR
jgi:hypothetical protein